MSTMSSVRPARTRGRAPRSLLWFGALLVALIVLVYLVLQAARSEPDVRTLSGGAQGHTQVVSALAFSPDGRFLVSGGENGNVKIWDLRTRTIVRTVWGGTRTVRSVAVSPDASLIASGNEDTSICRWEAATGRLLTPRGWHHAYAKEVAFSPDGSTLATGGSYSGGAMLWDVASGVRKSVLVVPGIHAGTFSPDGRRLVLATRDNVAVWDARTNRRVRALRGADLRDRLRLPSGLLRLFPFLVPPARERIGPIAVSPDGRLLAYASGRNVKLWRLPR